jgi:NADH-quinone oxidoreductase subunit C
LSSAEATAPADEMRQELLSGFEQELGDAVVGSHIRPGDDVWVRVRADAWRAAGELARTGLQLQYFGFLSALDWMPSPWGRYEDAQVDNPREPAKPGGPYESGYAGGDTRFQVFARVASVRRPIGVTLKVDVPDDTMEVDSWVPVYAGADWHERETWEMFGIRFTGHPGLRHIYLPGEFEGHPLRKDFPLLARVVKPWPGIVDVEPMPGEESEEGEAAGDEGDADKLPAVEAPVATHGESAAQEVLDEGKVAAQVAEAEAAPPGQEEEAAAEVAEVTPEVEEKIEAAAESGEEENGG